MTTNLDSAGPPPPSATFQKLAEKIAFTQARKQPRSPLPGKQPTACPDCEQSWIGLERRGACPACGLQYDEHTRAWFGKRTARLGTPILIALAMTIIAIAHYQRWWIVLPAAILVPLIVAWAIYDFLVSRDGRFIATTPRGVLYRIRSHRPTLIPWDRVVFAEATAYKMPIFKVHGKNRARRIRIHRAIRHCRDGCEFAVAVEDGLRRYAASHSASPRLAPPD